MVVEGSGGVSMFGVQLARLAGARVLATSSSDAKLQRARDAGEEAGVNYRSTPEWHERIIELTGGRGVDHVLEVGGESTLDRALRSLRYGGQLHIIGGLSGSFGAVNVGLMAARNAQVSRVYVGSVSMFEAMNRALSLQRVHPIVDRVFPFADAPAAFRYLESSAHVGKIVIQW